MADKKPTMTFDQQTVAHLRQAVQAKPTTPAPAPKSTAPTAKK